MEELPRSIDSLRFIAQLRVEQHRWVEFGLAFRGALPAAVLTVELGGGRGSLCFLLWLYYKPAVTHTNMHKQIQTWNRLMGLCGDQSGTSGIRSKFRRVGRR